MKSPKVSVIVPIYNVEPYLRRCLDSLVNQILEDIEIICINDCSPDNSLAILKEYAEKDEKVRIIDFEKNQGVSIARNAGMEMARGEYIGVVDPDDYVDLDFYEKLYLKAREKESDITCANVKTKRLGSVKEYIRPIDRFGKWCIPFPHWAAIYKTDFLRVYSLKHPEGIKYGQDVVFSVQALFFANKVEYGINTFYHCIQRENSGGSNIENAFKSNGMPLILDFINEKCTDKKEYSLLYEHFFYFAFSRLAPKSIYRHELTQFIVDIYKKRKYKTITLNLPKFIQESDLENAEALQKKINDNIDNINYINSYENLDTENLQNRKLYIWGAGLNGVDALAQCERNKWKIEAFLDSNRDLTEFKGYKVISPQDILSGKAKDYFIIISSHAYKDEIALLCEQAGLIEGIGFWTPFTRINN